jgi:hypothetical protein
MIGDQNIHMIVKRLVQFSSGLGGVYCVGMVPIYYMYTHILPDVLGHVVDPMSDNPIEPLVVYPLYVRLVEPGHERGDGYVLISSLVDHPYEIF